MSNQQSNHWSDVPFLGLSKLQEELDIPSSLLAMSQLEMLEARPQSVPPVEFESELDASSERWFDPYLYKTDAESGRVLERMYPAAVSSSESTSSSAPSPSIFHSSPSSALRFAIAKLRFIWLELRAEAEKLGVKELCGLYLHQLYSNAGDPLSSPHQTLQKAVEGLFLREDMKRAGEKTLDDCWAHVLLLPLVVTVATKGFTERIEKDASWTRDKIIEQQFKVSKNEFKYLKRRS